LMSWMMPLFSSIGTVCRQVQTSSSSSSTGHD
jgi:hypothetical protein